MKTRFAPIIVSACITALAATACAAPPTSETLHWFKGNLHTHTNKSDGDSTPAVVARWYRDHNYDFLALTDHNKFTDPKAVQAQLGAPAGRKPLLLIPGEEVSDGFNDGKQFHAVHVVALGTTCTLGKQGGASTSDVIARCDAAVTSAGGLAVLGHPNFVWSLTADDLLRQPEVTHFEVSNMSPAVHNAGGGGVPSTDQIWDRVLSTGRQLYGLATDDSHHLSLLDARHANPGRGWVCVRAAALTEGDILGALRSGNFYASTGVDLADLQTTGGVLRLRIAPGWTEFSGWQEKYTTQFIGKNGRILKTDLSLDPSYKLKAGDLYVRAKVTSSNGANAWTQPLFAGRRR